MLFPSTLVVGSNFTSINQMLANLGHQSITNNPDIYLISEYTVENIRSINNFLSLAPYNHQTKIVIIPNAELLNLESQNTLLKNLEEPGINNYFILLTAYPNSLISTILSRCQIIRLKDTTSKSDIPILRFPKLVGESLLLSETLPKDKNEFLIFLNNQISLYQQQLISQPNSQTSLIINKLIKATKMVKANVDLKSTADFLLLS